MEDASGSGPDGSPVRPVKSTQLRSRASAPKTVKNTGGVSRNLQVTTVTTNFGVAEDRPTQSNRISRSFYAVEVKLTLRDRRPDASPHNDCDGLPRSTAHKGSRVACSTRSRLRNSNNSMPVSRPATACAKNGPRAGIRQRHGDSPAEPVINVSFDEKPPNEQQELMQELQTRVGVLQQAMKGKRIAEHHVRSCELRVKKG